MRIAALRAASVAALAACSLFIAIPAAAGSISRQGFDLPAEGSVKIVVFRPDVRVGSMRIGGLDEPNAEWTATARENIQNAMEEQARAMDARLDFLDDLEGENAELLTQYRGLFEAVAGAMMQHVTLADELPTKETEVVVPGRARPRKVTELDWTLGEGARELKAVTGADYAMFVFTHDAYGDTGRKVAQVLMAGLFGAYVQAGIHIGYAGLVDLETGNIVWFNTDLAMGGDPREVDGAQKRVRQLLEGFPNRAAPAAAVAAN
jgi:hypothetical protein